MYAEANRVRIVLLVELCRIVILLDYVLRSLTEIMNSSSNDEDFAFDIVEINELDQVRTRLDLVKLFN